MRITEPDIQKLALKLLETFSRQDPRRRGFERYWPLAGPLGAFSEHAVGELEQSVAKALQDALEALLRQTAPKSFHLDADAVTTHLGAKAGPPRPYRTKRRA